MALELKTGDVLTLRKPHPCGGYDWTVVIPGADVSLLCNTCGHTIMLPLAVMQKRIKRVTPAG